MAETVDLGCGIQFDRCVNDKLARGYVVRVESKCVEAQLTQEVLKRQPSYRLAGFRKGKVPLDKMRTLLQDELLPQALEKSAQEASKKVLEKESLVPAWRPEYAIKGYTPDKELVFDLNLEVKPNLSDISFKGITLENCTIEVTDKEVDEALKRFAEQRATFQEMDENRPCKKDDILMVDLCLGTESKAPKREKVSTEFVDKTFGTSFQKELVGQEVGCTLTQKGTYPAHWVAQKKAGKDVEIVVTLRAIGKMATPPLDDALAQQVQLDNLEALKTALREKLQAEKDELTFMWLKRQVLDYFAEQNNFDVPERFVESDFRGIWEGLHRDLGISSHVHQGGEACHHEHHQNRISTEEHARQIKEKTGKTVEELRQFYRAVAERRVRLGFVIESIGHENKLDPTPEELSQALRQELMKYPGHEKEILNYYRQNKSAMASIRAPLFEEKVVRYVLDRAKKTNKKVTQEELEKRLETEENSAIFQTKST